MAEGILVGAIVLAAAVFAVYRLLVRPQCGCACGSGRHTGSSCCSDKKGACSCEK